jgi:hypothetical protein
MKSGTAPDNARLPTSEPASIAPKHAMMTIIPPRRDVATW